MALVLILNAEGKIVEERQIRIGVVTTIDIEEQNQGSYLLFIKDDHGKLLKQAFISKIN